MKKTLSSQNEVTIRFNEVDSMEVVWHGHYIQYFEEGREAFGEKFGIGYNQVKAHGYTIPIVSLSCLYKLPIQYGDKAIIETTYIDCLAPKIEFEYTIYRASDRKIAATGKTTQVLLNSKGELQLIIPTFIQDWKIKNGLL